MASCGTAGTCAAGIWTWWFCVPHVVPHVVSASPVKHFQDLSSMRIFSPRFSAEPKENLIPMQMQSVKFAALPREPIATPSSILGALNGCLDWPLRPYASYWDWLRKALIFSEPLRPSGRAAQVHTSLIVAPEHCLDRTSQLWGIGVRIRGKHKTNRQKRVNGAFQWGKWEGVGGLSLGSFGCK